jgi:ATP phosphoribosyltransferase regulatory subunit
VLGRAAETLPTLPEVRAALADLARLAGLLGDLPLSFDLADLRGYHYHSGVVFAAYTGGSAAALALGGRYDRVGEAFGRGRPATGFSLDLRQFVQRGGMSAAGAILAPLDGDAALADVVAGLRAAGEIVMNELPGHSGTWKAAGCDRQLVRSADGWIVVALHGEG